jgi:hypothetical protein
MPVVLGHAAGRKTALLSMTVVRAARLSTAALARSALAHAALAGSATLGKAALGEAGLRHAGQSVTARLLSGTAGRQPVAR